MSPRPAHTSIIKAAVTWWENRRPAEWTVVRHLEYPHHRITGAAECALADAVADYIRTLKGIE